MEKGQKVTICDGSYMATIIDGQIRHSSKHILTIGWNQDIWTVIEHGGKYPTVNNEDSYYKNGEKKINDTIICNNVNGEIWYCIASISLKKINEPKIPEYTMSELQKIVGHKFKIVK